tara:strand:- start:1111 stop:1275 length:165 start_codon:yes stop_codon:yes gene_type:complete
MHKNNFPHNPYIGMIYYNGFTEKTYEFQEYPKINSDQTVLTMKPRWVDITWELI